MIAGQRSELLCSWRFERSFTGGTTPDYGLGCCFRGANFIARTNVPSDRVAQAVRTAAQDVDPDVTLDEFATLKARFAFNHDLMQDSGSAVNRGMRQIMIRQPLVLSGVLWLGMAIVGAGGSGINDGDQTVVQPPKPDQTVTIVGCLVQGDPTLNATQRPADVSAASEGDFFVRTPVIQIPVGTTLTIGGSGTADKTALYRVMGLSRDELRQHLDHRVELQGYLRSDDKALGVATTTTVDAGGQPTTKVEKRMDLAGALQATSMKMVSASCQ